MNQIVIQPQNWGYDYCGRLRRIGPMRKLDANHDVQIFAASCNHRVIGTISIDVCLEPDQLWIMDIFVKKSMRRQGIGHRLMQHIVNQYPDRKLRGVFLQETIKKFAAQHNAKDENKTTYQSIHSI